MWGTYNKRHYLVGPFMEQPLLEWWGDVKDTVLYHLDAHSVVGGS